MEDDLTPSLCAGLASNVGLTAMKAVAGVMMNSASLVAEAGHSLSDLLGVRWGRLGVRLQDQADSYDRTL